jgi:CRISP-associated protein Cas1
MAILFLTEQGCTVNLTGGRVVVRKGEEALQELPVYKLEQIVAYGNVHLSNAVIAHCLEQGIEVSYLSSRGKYRGRLQPEFTKSVLARQAQHQRAADKEFCLRLAATFVTGKVRNMIAMVKQQKRLREDGRSPLSELEATLPKIPTATSLDQLNGYEGIASKAYFGAFRAALKGDWDFTARQYNPAPDPVNALLSLGYTMLYNDTQAAVNIAGLDAYQGFFHQPRHGHAALASDLMEELRAVIVDRLILSLLNKRVITAHDFQRDERERITLKPEVLKRFFGFYAQALQERTFYPYSGVQTSFRQVLQLQARHLARVLVDEEKAYRPFDAAAALNGR